MHKKDKFGGKKKDKFLIFYREGEPFEKYALQGKFVQELDTAYQKGLWSI